MNLAIKPDLEKFVREAVDAGQFADPSDAVNQALQMLKDLHAESEPAYQAYLKRELAIGLEQLDRGEVVTDFDLERFLADRHREYNASKATAR